MEVENENLAERLNREVEESKNDSDQNNESNDGTREKESDKNNDIEVKSNDINSKTDENDDELHEKGDNCSESVATKQDDTSNGNDSASGYAADSPCSEDKQVKVGESSDSPCSEDKQVKVGECTDSPCSEDEQVKVGECANTKADTDEEFEDLSEDSGSDAEYESAEEGEEIQVDKENLKELENALSDEEKEERRNSAQKLKEEGNELFRCGSYKSAIRIYSRALRTCPLKFSKDRSIMYSNRGACKMRLEDYEESIRDCSKALDLHPVYMKALMRRAELYEKTDKLDEALIDYQKIVELDPSQHAARSACMRLPDQIKEKNEKLKEEMMGKLKDLGNMILRPFGLSTNNFQMKQDPATGGYSVNFVQNSEQK